MRLLFTALVALLVVVSTVRCSDLVQKGPDGRQSGRIVGGSAVSSLGTYPSICLFIISSGGSLSAACGSTLVTSQYVVTAAHCTANQIASDIFIRCGIISTTTSNTQKGVSTIYDHPNYNSGSSDNDVSLLRLDSAYTLTSTLNVVTLPTQGVDVTVGTSCQIAGWGDITENAGFGSSSLRHAAVPIISNTVCQSWYDSGVDGTANIASTNVCAGFQAGGVDTCQGDSGGPLYCSGVLQGITSFGIGCARPNYPGVYARVSDYRDWINSTIAGNPGVTGTANGNGRSVFGILFTVSFMLLLAQM